MQAIISPAAMISGLGDCPNFDFDLDYGANGAIPAFGKMTFSLGSCDLGVGSDAEFSSFVQLRKNGGRFLWFNYYYDETGRCNDEKKFCYVNFSYDDNLDGKVRSIRVDTIKDHCTCAGSLSHEYGQDARFDDESCFSKAHVLCNDGNIVSMVSQSTKNPSKYSLFYSTKTPDEDLNEKSGHNQMSQDFMKVTGGKYCGTNMYKTVTYLQNDLKKSNAFDWKCQENQPETCASDYDYGSCHPKQHEGNNSTREEEPPPEKNNKVDKCNGTPSPCVGNSVATCNKISGCHFLLGYWYGGIYTPTKCWGPPTPSSNFNDDKARCVKHGCTYRKPKSSSGSSSSIFNIVGFVVAGVAGVVLIGGIVALITWHIRYRERFRKEQDREVLPMSRSDDEPSSSMSGGVAASMQSSKSTKGHSKSGGVAASKQSSFPPPKGHVYRKQYPSSTAQPWVQKEEETPIHPIGKNRSPVLSDSAKGKKEVNVGGDVNSKSSFPSTYPLPSSLSRRSEDNETRMDGKHVTAIDIASREKKIKKYEKRLRNIARIEHKVEKRGDSSLTDEQRDKLETKAATTSKLNRLLQEDEHVGESESDTLSASSTTEHEVDELSPPLPTKTITIASST